MDELLKHSQLLQQTINYINSPEGSLIQLMTGYNAIFWGLIGFAANWKFKVKNKPERLRNFLIPLAIGSIMTGSAMIISTLK